MKLRLPNKLIAAIMAAASPVLFHTLSTATMGAAAVAVVTSNQAHGVVIDTTGETVQVQTLQSRDTVTGSGTLQLNVNGFADGEGHQLSISFDENWSGTLDASTMADNYLADGGHWLNPGEYKKHMYELLTSTAVAGGTIKLRDSGLVLQLGGNNNATGFPKGSDDIDNPVSVNFASATIKTTAGNLRLSDYDGYRTWVVGKGSALEVNGQLWIDHRQNLSIQNGGRVEAGGVLKLGHDDNVNSSDLTMGGGASVLRVQAIETHSSTNTVQSCDINITGGTVEFTKATGNVLSVANHASVNIGGTEDEYVHLKADSAAWSLWHSGMTIGNIAVDAPKTGAAKQITLGSNGVITTFNGTVANNGGSLKITGTVGGTLVIDALTQEDGTKAGGTITLNAITYSNDLTVNGGTVIMSGDNSNFTGNILVDGVGSMIKFSPNPANSHENDKSLGVTNKVGFDAADSSRVIKAQNGGIIDVNGAANEPTNNYTLTLGHGGKVQNTGADIGDGSMQLSRISVVRDGEAAEVAVAEVGGDHLFGLLNNGWNPTRLNLNGNTLRKVDNNIFMLINTTVSEGTLDINAGTLQIASGGNANRSTDASAAQLLFSGAGTLSVKSTSSNTFSIRGIGMATDYTGAGTITGAGNMVIKTQEEDNYSFRGVITGNTNVTTHTDSLGKQTFELTGDSTVGAIGVNGGEVAFMGSGILSANSITSTNGTITFGDTENHTAFSATVTNANHDATWTLGTNGSNSSTNTIAQGAEVTVDRVMAGWGFDKFVVDGTLNTRLFNLATGNQNYTVSGTGTVNTDKLELGNQGQYELTLSRINIGSGGIDRTSTGNANLRKFNNTTFGALDDWTGTQAYELANTVTFDTSNAETTANDGSGHTITLSGVLSGSGSLVKEGSGTLVFGAANTYTGTTHIKKGTMQTALNSGTWTIIDKITFDAGTKLLVSAGSTGTGVMEIQGNDSLSSLLGNANVEVTGGTLRLGKDANTTTGDNFAANFMLSGGVLDLRTQQDVTKTFNGTLSMTDGSTLRLHDGGAAFSGAISLNGTVNMLANWGKDGIQLNGSLTGNGTVYMKNDGNLDASSTRQKFTVSHADNAFNGTVVVGQDSNGNKNNKTELVVNNTTALQYAIVDLAAGEKAELQLGVSTVTLAGLKGTTGSNLHKGSLAASVFTLNTAQDGDYTYGGSVQSGISLVKSGSGAQTFTGNMSAFNGDIQVQKGTLHVATDTITQAKHVVVAADALLKLKENASLTVNELVLGNTTGTAPAAETDPMFRETPAPVVVSDGDVNVDIEVTGTQSDPGTLAVGMGGTDVRGTNLTVSGTVDYSAVPGNILNLNGGSLTLSTLSQPTITLSDSLLTPLESQQMVEVMSGIGALTVNDFSLSADAISAMRAGDLVVVGTASSVFGNNFGNQNAQVLFRADGGTGTLLVTPEPATATLSLLALGALAARRRRK